MSDKSYSGIWTDADIRKLLDEVAELRKENTQLIEWGQRAFASLEVAQDEQAWKASAILDSAPKVIREGAKQA